MQHAPVSIYTNQLEMIKHPSMKSLQILSALAYSESSTFTISELCTITGLSASTVHRILQELLECRFIAKNEATKEYRLGSETLSLAMRVRTSGYLLEISTSEMRRMNNLTGETIHLIVRVDDLAMYAGKIETKNPIGLRSQVGGKKPLSCTSGGKVILANEDRKWVREYLDNTPLKRYTDYTITERDVFEHELETIREKGYAIDNRENNPDVQCISVPIFSNGGIVAGALSIAAPYYRFSLSLALSFEKELKKSGEIISKKLSGN